MQMPGPQLLAVHAFSMAAVLGRLVDLSSGYIDMLRGPLGRKAQEARETGDTHKEDITP